MTQKITKEAYLKKKEQERINDQNVPRKNYCYQCMRPVAQCLCKSVVQVKTKVKIVILMHPMEAKYEKLGTGRITHLSLPNSEIIVGLDFSNDEKVNEYINNSMYSAYVLYPGEKSINVSLEKKEIKDSLIFSDFNESKEIVLFVIDGTWPCAKKMMKLSKNLHHLPRISFEVKSPSIFRIKEQPDDFCLSTIESIQLLIQNLVRLELEVKDPNLVRMLTPFEEMIEFQVKCAEDPTLPSYKRFKKPYKTTEERVKSKKWETRKIIF